ncbi:MAG: DUF992 domain-containing protein [Rhodospirillaceae bacterium]|nr:DUF992 domain-containing protein [Rhodospirillaceae bacterium]
MMKKRIAALLTATLAFGVLAGQAAAQDRVKAYIGSLSCNVSGSVGLIFGSTKELSCAFLTIQGTSEHYQGSIDKFGIDVGYTKPVHVVWHVYSLGSGRSAGVLAGKFVGSQGSVSVGSGAGGNLLLGGRNNEIVLQSAGIQANAGYNFADGVAELALKSAP